MSVEDDVQVLEGVQSRLEEVWNQASGIKEILGECADTLNGVIGSTRPTDVVEVLKIIEREMNNCEKVQNASTAMQDGLAAYVLVITQ